MANRDGNDDPRIPHNPAPDIRYLQSVFPKCKGVRQVLIRVPWGIGGFWPLLPDDYITQFLVGFKTLYRVNFRIPHTMMSQQVIGHFRPNFTGGPIEHTNQLLGTTARTKGVYVTPELPYPVITTTLYSVDSEDPAAQAHNFSYLEEEDRFAWINYEPRPLMETWQWKARGNLKYLKEVTVG